MNLNNLNKKLEEVRNQMQEAFFQEIKNLFLEDQRLESFSFCQFTPYFMDGDECVFCFGGVTKVNRQDIYDYESDEEKMYFDSVQSKIDILFNQIPDEMLLIIWGDHVEVTIKKDGTQYTEKYKHD